MELFQTDKYSLLYNKRSVKKLNGSETSCKIFFFGPNLWHQYAYTVMVKSAKDRAGSMMYNEKYRHIIRRHDTI